MEGKIINDSTAEKISGGGPHGTGDNESERTRPPECYKCRSENLEYLGSEYINELKMTIKHYRCKDCGNEW